MRRRRPKIAGGAFSFSEIYLSVERVPSGARGMSAALWNEPEHGAIEDSGWVNEVVCGTSVGGNLFGAGGRC
jgi:hypothetical protein